MKIKIKHIDRQYMKKILNRTSIYEYGYSKTEIITISPNLDSRKYKNVDA